MSDRQTAALAYARRGWRVVPTRGKNPGGYIGRGWQHKATIDEATIRAWWRRWPAANVGVVVGDSFLALDVDPRDGGDDCMRALERDLGPLPETPAYLTGADGGQRVLLAHPGGDLLHELAPGVEVKHGAKVIVMPPSVHPDTGRRYEWDLGPDEVALAAAPEAWRDRLAAPARPVVHADRGDDAVGHADRGDDALLAIPAETYIEALTGRTPDRRGYVQCPLHAGGEERTPSLRPYGDGGWACFACPPRPGAGRRCLGGTIYTLAALVWGYPLPLRGPAFLVVEARLLDVITDFLLARNAA